MIGQKLIPFEGVDLNSNELYISDKKAPFLKNITFELNKQSGSANGQNVGVFTPMEGNELYCDPFLPAGTNICIGTRSIKEINQTLVFVYNSLNNHLIYRLNGATGTCEKVSQNSCWNFQYNPKNFISEGRCATQTITRYNKTLDKDETVTYVIFTDNFNPVWSFVIEDIIATNSYDATLFPYFSVNDPAFQKCDLFKLGVPTPMDCVTVTPIKRNTADPAERVKPNLLAYRAWEFRTCDINGYGQDSEHGAISEQYIGVTGNACIESSSGIARCLRLKFKAGSPLIEKIQVEYRNCNGAIRGFSVESDWFLYDVIEKYQNCDKNKNWWERQINSPWHDEYNAQITAGKSPTEATRIADSKDLLKYNASDNTFEYTFCGNKECTAIPVKQTNRLENPLSLTAASVFSLNKGIGLARLRKGFEPIDCSELDKINFQVNKPQPTADACKSKLHRITVWAVIYNPFDNQPSRLKLDNGRVKYGNADCNQNNGFTYGQFLPVDQEGFIGYLAGTDHYAISSQYRYNRTTKEKFNDGLDWAPSASVLNFTEVALQKWEMDVPPGNYIFRVASQSASPNDEYQKTSLAMGGITSINNIGPVTDDRKEIRINACNGDVDLMDTPVIIYDFTHVGKGCAIVDKSSVVMGYAYEDEIDRRPLEKATVVPNRNTTVQSQYTDHNGFFFAATLRNHLAVSVFSLKDCKIEKIGTTRETSNGTPASGYLLGLVGALLLYAANDRFVKQDLFVYKGKDKFLRKDQLFITGKVVLCDDANIGINGALVLLTQGQHAYTDINGDFTIVAHRSHDYTRNEQVFVSQKGTCILLGCNTADCNYCFADHTVSFPGCDGTSRTITIPTVSVRIKGLNKRGPTMGGRYAIGAVLHDWLGRETNVQIRDKHYIDIPSLQETGVYDFSSISFSIDPSFEVPKQFRKMSFYITENLSHDDYLTWVAERVQYVDNTGNSNTAAPTQIRLYYEGLGEYNKQNDFSTNAVWQFINDKDAPVLGDQVEFLAKADGSIFPTRITSLVKYDKLGKYVSVDFTDELRNLKDGVLIRLIRPKQCINKQFYYQLCPIITLVDGKPLLHSGALPFADAYMLTRQIPVPIELKKKEADADGKEIETSSTINQLKSYPFLFEHHSPSDFWGDHCYSKGRINTKNPYESQKTLDTAIHPSKSLSNDATLNNLHYFDNEDMVVFNEQEWGGITAVLPEIHFLLVLCEQNNFTLGYDDGTLRQRKDGTISASGADGMFGKPERRAGSDFGCNMNDISTIRKYAGLVMFVDRSKSALVLHNYKDCKDVSANTFKDLIKTMIRRVLPGERYLFAGIDPKTKKYVLSVQDLKLAGKSFINDLDFVSYVDNETIAVDVFLQTFNGNRSFVPEYYGAIESDISDEQFISIVNGRPYKHHNTSVPYCNYYGVQCKPRISGVANLESTKEKTYLAMELYCQGVLLEAYRIETGAGQLSRIKQKWWDKRNTFYCAPFLCDINSRLDPNLAMQTGANKLLDGDTLYGRWVSFYLTPRIEDLGKYFEYTAAIVFFNGVEKSSTG